MSHKFTWRSFAAACSLILTSSAAYSQPESTTQIDLSKSQIQNADFIVLDARLAEPDFIVGAGGFGPGSLCQFPPGGRSPFMPPGGPHAGGPMMMMPPPIFAGVDLTDDQISRIAKLKRSFETSNITAHQSLYSSENEMRDLLSSADFGESQIRKVAEEIAQQKSDQSKRLSSHMLEVAKVLSAA
ncbi:MAG: periplasmic heavy metal sensor, partial [Leptolyngbya sp.]|nr:periplasmic heavy metal sensor [Candidatus Melainabacteria bacterium]